MSAIPRRKLSVEEYLHVERLAPFKSEFYDGVMYPTEHGEGEMVMSAIPRRKLSDAEYLAVERVAPFRSEFYDGEMYAMAGARLPHNRIKDNLIRHLGNQLDGTSCFTASTDMRVRIPGTPSFYTYPDIPIVCGEPVLEDDVMDTLLNPRVLIEVLSPTTEDYDRGFKRVQSMRIPSLQEYTLVSSDEPRIEQHFRRDDGTWDIAVAEGIASTLELRGVAASIPFSDIYAGVTFAEGKS
jgi:Uma2 family endonuclease